MIVLAEVVGTVKQIGAALIADSWKGYNAAAAVASAIGLVFGNLDISARRTSCISKLAQ